MESSDNLPLVVSLHPPAHTHSPSSQLSAIALQPGHPGLLPHRGEGQSGWLNTKRV